MKRGLRLCWITKCKFVEKRIVVVLCNKEYGYILEGLQVSYVLNCIFTIRSVQTCR